MSVAAEQAIRVAFIGGALHSAVGYTHFNASRLDGYFSLEAGCFSRDANENARTAAAYGVPEDRNYTDCQAMLEAEQGRVDAVVVLTPTPSHAEIVCKALEAGYPVICEKALGTSVEECERIQATVARNNGYLAVTYNYSGYPMVRELKRLIEEGDLGALQQIHIEMPQEGFSLSGVNPQKWRQQDYAIPTVSLDLGVHVHHLVRFLAGSAAPVAVLGDQASYGRVDGVVDNVYFLSRHQQQLRVQGWWGKTALGHKNGLRVRVFGEKGSAEWVQLSPEQLHWADDKGRRSIIERGSAGADLANTTRYNRFKAGHPSGFIEAFSNLYADIAEELRARKSGLSAKSRFVYGVDHAIDGMRFLQAIDQSAKQSAWVSVEPN